ncbi:uncharacterized protein LOC122543229 isoform X2 [Chiloscyllium plagiosum]|uniref:uncharacterized protein LOC122543229 isoform X2 n=1 Tax=Chiloscyllium plagiosum TaxID=36176 RepID=UPI001CB818CF|nr:uncharacterized protein LOC122543229 isoform X2 [Chiloscyllium plagiosum]
MELCVRLVWLLIAFPLLESALMIYSKNSGHCVDHADRTVHRLGSRWRNSDCQICQCLHTIVACRNSYSTPQVYPDDCVAVFERDNCRYRLQKKSNPMVECQAWREAGGICLPAVPAYSPGRILLLSRNPEHNLYRQWRRVSAGSKFDKFRLYEMCLLNRRDPLLFHGPHACSHPRRLCCSFPSGSVSLPRAQGERQLSGMPSVQQRPVVS